MSHVGIVIKSRSETQYKDWSTRSCGWILNQAAAHTQMVHSWWKLLLHLDVQLRCSSTCLYFGCAFSLWFLPFSLLCIGWSSSYAVSSQWKQWEKTSKRLSVFWSSYQLVLAMTQLDWNSTCILLTPTGDWQTHYNWWRVEESVCSDQCQVWQHLQGIYRTSLDHSFSSLEYAPSMQKGRALIGLDGRLLSL